MSYMGRPLLWMCGCCALLETTFQDDDEAPRCSLCREVCTDDHCNLRRWLDKQIAAMKADDEPA